MFPVRIILPLALLPVAGWAQQLTFGPTLTQIVSSGGGVATACDQAEYGTGFGLRLGVPVLTTRTTLQLAGRGYWVSRGSDCVDGLPPPDGTYIQDDRVNLLSASFITTDVRLATRLGDAPISLAVGGGNAWHESHDLPYLVFAAELSLVDRPDVQLGLQGEYQWLRVSSDRFRRTFQNSALVAEEALGRVHQWSHAFLIALTLGFPL